MQFGISHLAGPYLAGPLVWSHCHLQVYINDVAFQPHTMTTEPPRWKYLSWPRYGKTNQADHLWAVAQDINGMYFLAYHFMPPDLCYNSPIQVEIDSFEQQEMINPFAILDCDNLSPWNCVLMTV